MRLLISLIMISLFRAKACPVKCECNDFLRDPLRGHLVYTKVRCESLPNVTKEIPATVNKLILSRISTLDVHNFLDNLRNNSQLFPYLFHLSLTRCAISNLSNVSFSGLERLQSLDLSRSEVKHLLNPEIDFNLTSLRALDLSNNEIRIIEGCPFKTLTSLEVLNLSANVIDTLTKNTFSGLAKLQCLDLSSNKLTTLEGEAFAPLSALQHLNLSNNLLQVLAEACLSSLQRLQQLDVSWNRLARVAPGSLQLPSLSRLLLAGNYALGTSRGPALLVGPGKRLQTVDASQTGLKQVPAALTHSIRTLRLAGNSIRTVSCGHFDSYPLLQLLDFTSNELEEIEDDALGRLDVLFILYLSDNKLRKIPKNLPERLKVLHLEHNRIEEILPGDFERTRLLEVLQLSDNKIRVVREGAFSQMEALATLDLSHNPISILPPGILSGPWQLQVLRLSNLNVISPVEEMSFPLPTPEFLVTLDLSNSPWLGRQFLADTAALAAAKELQELNLEGVGVEHIRSDLLHFLPQLRIFNIINNPLNCSDLQWLATWMRRQDHLESRRVTCSSPAELSGSLLVDLQNIESVVLESTTPEVHTSRVTETSLEESISKSTQFPDAISVPGLRLPGKSKTVSDDGLSYKHNVSFIPTTTIEASTLQEVVANVTEESVEFVNKSANFSPNKLEPSVESSKKESRENATRTTGRMSMFAETNRRKNLAHPAILALFMAILSSSALIVLLATKFKRRRWNNCHQQERQEYLQQQQRDIEVSSLSNVTELW